MKGYIDSSKPDDQFWEIYTELWDNSLYRSVFQTPQLLKYYGEVADSKVAIYKCIKEERLIGAAFFKGSKKGYQFLSDLKGDHNFFVIHKDCTEQEIDTFFRLFLEAVKKENWALTLNSQPSWASYVDTFHRVAKESGLFWNTSKVSVCPMLEAETPDALFTSLNKSKNNRYKMNRLIKEKAPVFEVFTDYEDLDEWTEQFCQTHLKRWKGTPTPSKFRDVQHKHFLKGCLRSWVQDGVLVRFSLRVADERIAFVVGLVQENSLVYHSLTYDPAYSLYSPGKVLVLFLGQWMKTQHLSVLDFGHGDEDYKYQFANKDPQLYTIFISQFFNLPFILKAEFIKIIRENPVLIKLYREKIKLFIRNVIQFG